MEHMDEVMESYMNLQSLLHRYYMMKGKGRGPHANPHRGQGRILSILKLQPEITQKELTYLLDMRPQSLGELLTKLEKAAFITREPDEGDRRIMVVKLTEAGREEAEKMNQEEETSVFDVLSDEEKVEFQALLNKLAAAIEAELSEDMRDMRGFHGGPHGGMHGREGFGFHVGPRGRGDFSKRRHHHHHHPKEEGNFWYGMFGENDHHNDEADGFADF